MKIQITEQDINKMVYSSIKKLMNEMKRSEREAMLAAMHDINAEKDDELDAVRHDDSYSDYWEKDNEYGFHRHVKPEYLDPIDDLSFGDDY